jgi:hypothetical protein
VAVNSPISTWIIWAKISQYLDANRKAKRAVFSGGTIVPDYVQILRMVRTSVEWAYGQNPNDETLNVTGPYLYSLIDVNAAKIIAAGGSCIPPAITQNPNSQTISSGGTATFSVFATGTGTLSYQWQLNLTNINGATSSSYTTPSVTTGGSYRVLVTNACGTVVSATATLTVNAPAINFVIGWSATDPFVNNTTPLTITNAQTISFTPGSSMIFSGSLAAFSNNYVMWSYSSSEGLFAIWSNGDPSTAINKGVIPDFSVRDIYTVGATNYICCRNPLVLDTALDLRIIH